MTHPDIDGILAWIDALGGVVVDLDAPLDPLDE